MTRLPVVTWAMVIKHWHMYGATDGIERLIMRGEPVPEDCRQSLCDIVAGRAKRPRGNPNPPYANWRTMLRDIDIRGEYLDLRDAGVKAMDAKSSIAERYHLSVAAIDTIVRGIWRKKT